MLGCWRLLIVLASLLTGTAASAQDNRGFLGVDLQDVTKVEADKLGWEAPRGVRVVKPHPKGPAANAGIVADDVITSLDGTDVENMPGFVASIDSRSAGTQVRLRLLRAGKERNFAVTLGRRPAELAQVRVPEKRELPILQLDTGGHMGLIKGLAFTPDGKQIVTAGDDKVIRVWDWQAGKTARTIRGQVGAGDEGKVYAMALSPDGRWLAAGGFMAAFNGSNHQDVGTIRLYEFATGRLVALLKGHTNVVNSLAFSPDGTQLISGSDDHTAITWGIESRKLVHQLKGHRDHIYAVGFTPDGARTVTGSYDSTLKLWSVKDGKEIATLAGHKDTIRALAVSPADGSIASGSVDGEIRLWNGKTGAFLRTLANQGSQAGTLAFSPDGKRLLSTCGGGPPCSLEPQIVWDVASGERLQQPKYHDNIVLAAAVSPDGSLVATGGGGGREVHVWDLQTGKTRHVLAGKGAPGWAAGFSADGSRIAWGNTWRSAPGRQTHSSEATSPLAVQFRLPAGSQALGRPERIDESVAKSFVRARTALGTYALAHRKGGGYGGDAILDLKKDGQTLVSIERGSADGYDHRSFTFTPDGQTIVSGGNGRLIAYDLKGQRVGNFVGHEGDVWAVTPSPDGGLLVSGSDDQTVRLWNLKTRELIVTLFHGSDGEWVMWTPQGYYTGSPGSDKIVGWQVNKGPENAADYVGADQLRDHLNRPDIVEKAIILASAEQAVRESPGTSFTLADLLVRPVPKFRILSPAGGAIVRGGRTQVKIAVEAVPDAIKTIRIQVNDRQVEEMTPPIGSGGFQPGERSLDVPLAKGRNEVRITLRNAIGDKVEAVTIVHDGDGDLDKRGTLYIVAIGVDRYPGLGKTCGEDGKASCDLRFSGADARRLADAAEKRLASSHSKVIKRVLVNGAAGAAAPTARNIIDAIDILKLARETDTVLLFIAGHGVNEGPSYRFLATDAERTGDTYRGITVVPWQILQEAVELARGRRVLFIDTCHAGNAYNRKLGNAAYHANIIAYSAARFDQEALEDAKLGHGLFTYAIVEGLEGKGNVGARREISTKELAEYIVKRVDQLAKAMSSEQEPQYFKGRDAEDYVLARW
jgi:WD40 repeat protein